MASSLYDELKPYGIKVCTINPGPYRTGFNDRMFDTKDIWYNKKNNFTNEKDFEPMQDFLDNNQYQPNEMIDFMVKYIPMEQHKYRLMDPRKEKIIMDGFNSQRDLWSREM